VGGSTSTSVDITTGHFSFSFGTADDGDSGAGGGGGPFHFLKKKSREDIVRSVVLVFGVLSWLVLKHTGPSMPVKSDQ